MDERTRVPDVAQNAAMLLALMWYYAGNGKGGKDMVVLPYKIGSHCLPNISSKLVMESLGKEKNLAGEIVHQGIACTGIKAQTDQHSYVQTTARRRPEFFCDICGSAQRSSRRAV